MATGTIGCDESSAEGIDSTYAETVPIGALRKAGTTIVGATANKL